MKLYKLLYKFSLFVGLLLLVVGIIQKSSDISARGITFSKYGNISYGILDENGTLFLSFGCLLLSLWSRKVFLDLEKERQQKLKNEKQEFRQNKRKR
ncbi:hypothetical protein [Flavobacterium sp.]|uniref:hypothetical protein n=1 Tax=Flavobacterium sp. TaxID=239 RepID=UPI00391CCB37